MTLTLTDAPRVHAVQFYEDERFLHRAIANFFAEPLGSSDPVVMVARRRTFEGVAEHLASGGDAPPVDAASRIVFVDAETALREFMDGDTPDPVAFEQRFSRLLAEVRRGKGDAPVWIFGEMVDVLCREGNHSAAIRLEELWNDRVGADRIAVLCGYSIDTFDEQENAGPLRTICSQHTHVTPTETFTNTSTPAVYIVDDDASVRSSVARLLASVDVPSHTFASAEAFLAEVGQTSNGCLLVDIQLLGMSGQELQTLLASRQWSMPVIAMSGSYDDRIEKIALRRGAIAFLRKPFEAQELIDAVTRALS
jgi:CheY-like chemotaxis protein